MPKHSDPATLQRKRWLKALGIARILFEEDGYHTAYLSEIEAFIQHAAAPRHDSNASPTLSELAERLRATDRWEDIAEIYEAIRTLAAQGPQPDAGRYRIDHYPSSRFWAVYAGEDPVAVTVYRKGAREVTARLQAQERAIAELKRQMAAAALCTRRPMMDYVLASLNPPSIWNFSPSAEAAAKTALVNDYSRRLDARLGAPERRYEVMTYDAYKAAERQWYLGDPLEEITGKHYHEAREVLPPEHYQHTGELESFLMSEHLSGPYTHHYVAHQGRYFTRVVDATDRSTWITVQDIHALTHPEAAPPPSDPGRPHGHRVIDADGRGPLGAPPQR